MDKKIYQDSEFGVAEYDTAGSLRAGRIPEHQMVIETIDNGNDATVDMAPTLRKGGDGGQGQAMAIAFAQNTRDEVRLQGGDGQIAGALAAEAGMKQQTYLAVNIYGGNKRSDRPEGGFYVKEEETSKTLDAASGLNPTCSQGGTAVLSAPTFGIPGNWIGRKPENGGNATAPMIDVAPNLTSTDRHGVVAPCLSASNDPSRSPQSSEVTQQVSAVLQASMQVRRLTPVECERLQSFPDNYTNIPWRGKPESPDGPRYKALGNSMCCNVMHWIGKRIKEHVA